MYELLTGTMCICEALEHLGTYVHMYDFSVMGLTGTSVHVDGLVDLMYTS